MAKHQHNLELIITTSSHMLPHILQVIEGHAQIVKVSPITKQQATPTTPPKKEFHYTNGIRNKGITGAELVLEILSEYGKASLDLLQNKFVEKGFSKNSAYPTAIKLLSQNKIARAGNKVYQLPPKK